MGKRHTHSEKRRMETGGYFYPATNCRKAPVVSTRITGQFEKEKRP